MKFFPRTFLASALLLGTALTSSAQTTGYDNLVARFTVVANRFVADPARRRIYASVPADNTVVVIETDLIRISKTIPIGLAPAGMAISPDGLTLYVALSGTTRIGVIDLTTLATLQPLNVAIKPWQVAAGLSNRLYITPLEDVDGLLQVDATTGATQATLDVHPYKAGLLQISPDYSALYFGDTQLDPSTLKRYDVSTATPVLVETSLPSTTGDGGVDLKLSHDGALLCYPNLDGNPSNPPERQRRRSDAGLSSIHDAPVTLVTDVIDPMDFTVRLGSFNIGPYPSVLTFSPDDKIAYEHRAGARQVVLFDTATFAQFSALAVPDDSVSDLITDESGQYLFVADGTAIEIYDLLADVTTSFYGTVGEPQNFQAPIYFEPTSIEATGLPAGLVFDPATKIISGTPTEDGTFEVVVTASDATHTVTANLTLVIYPDERAQNISTRLNVGVGMNVLVAGFIITGTDSQDIVVRGIGPSLEVGGEPIPTRLVNPMLELFDSSGAPIASNDDWQSDPQSAVLTSLGIAPTDPQEAALFRTLAPGAYTVIVSGVNDTTGIGLAEVYDFSAGTSRLANISTRGDIQTGDDVMIGGVIIGGNATAKMLFRVRGPSIVGIGLTMTLQDPQLDLYDAQGTKIAANDNWKDTQETEITATGLAPTDDRESAISISLAPGAYTAVASGVEGTTGVGLFEGYNLP